MEQLGAVPSVGRPGVSCGQETNNDVTSSGKMGTRVRRGEVLGAVVLGACGPRGALRLPALWPQVDMWPLSTGPGGRCLNLHSEKEPIP